MLQSDRRAQELELVHCKSDPWRFLTHWVHTIDANDKENPEKLFPNKIHLFTSCRFWEHYQTLLVPKSRQLSFTWLFAALYLWESFFFAHRLTFFQSKKADDANEVLLRTYQMWSTLPEWMRDWNPMQKIYAYAEFGKSKSRIIGIPQGADSVRGFTPTGVLIDESSYVAEADQLVAAIRPALRGGGRLTMVSSAAPSVFGNLVLDQ